MTEISRIALFGKLNKLGYQAVESATVFCKMRGNPYVEVVHWMHQILQGQDSDLHRIVDHYDLDPGKIAVLGPLHFCARQTALKNGCRRLEIGDLLRHRRIIGRRAQIDVYRRRNNRHRNDNR